MIGITKIAKKEFSLLFISVIIAAALFFGSYYVYAAGETPTLSIAVQSTMSVIISTDNFANLTPGTPVWATSTLSVTINDDNGWYVLLSGDNVSGNDTDETAQALNDGAGNEITDHDPQWTANAATTTAGTAASLSSGDDVLAFRVMTASGSAPFLSTTWWGTDDTPFTNALWAGISSSTDASKIGDAGAGSYSASAHLNTVQYYIDVAATQITGTYTGALTYTITAN